MFELGIFLTFVGLMYTIYQRISNKTAFFGFCFILAAAAGIAVYSIYQPHGEDLEANRIAREKIIAQQHVFSEWYTNYQKRIDSLDYNWQQYHTIITSLKNDDITQETAYERLCQLERDASDLQEIIKAMTPPATLNDDNYNLTNTVYHKTLKYSEAQLNTITLTKEAAKPTEAVPAEIKDNEAVTEAKPHPEKSKFIDLPHKLEKIMLVNAPAGLFNAKEISALRNNLTLPEDRTATEAPAQEKENIN
jgi:hypothetical protein